MKMKQVVVVNESLKLPRGKLSAQVAHAAVEAFIRASAETQQRWLNSGMPKVVLQGQSEDELLQLARRASEAGLPTGLIKDAGLTVVAPGTVTCLGIGPAEEKDIDRLTGGLALVK